MLVTGNFLNWGPLIFLLLSDAGLCARSQDRQPTPGQKALTVKRAYDEDASWWYTVYQAADTLYITVAVTDPLQQRKLVMNGMELWIDPRGQKNKKTGIVYPFRAMNNNDVNQREANRLPPMGIDPARDTGNRTSLEKTIACRHEMRLTGFKEALNGVQNNFHPSGIHVWVYFTKDTLVYQAQLPLNTLAEQPGVYSPLSVGLVAKGSPINGMGGAEMPPDRPGDGMMPPPPGSAPPGGVDGMRIFEDNISGYRLPLHDGSTVRKPVSDGDSSKNK